MQFCLESDNEFFLSGELLPEGLDLFAQRYHNFLFFVLSLFLILELQIFQIVLQL